MKNYIVYFHIYTNKGKVQLDGFFRANNKYELRQRIGNYLSSIYGFNEHYIDTIKAL